MKTTDTLLFGALGDPDRLFLRGLAAGLLQGNPAGQRRATLGEGLARGLLGGTQLAQQGEQQQMQREAFDLQKRQVEAQLAAQQQAAARAAQQQQLKAALPGLLGGQGMSPAGALALGAQQGSVGPTQANAQLMQARPAGAGGVSPQAMQTMLALGMKPDDMAKMANFRTWGQLDPVNMAPGNVLFDRNTRQPIFTAPTQPKLPDGWQMGPNGPQPIPGFEDFKKRIAASGATRVNVPVSVNTEKQLFGEVATGVGKQVATIADQARAAVGTINTVNQIRGALDSGKVMAGPGTKAVVLMRQLGSVLGLGGKNNDEVLSNTRTAIQGMAQLELDAAQQMKGQGQITEAERAIIRRAAAGSLDEMTTGEVRTLLGVLDRTARYKIAQHQRNVEQMGMQPGAAPMLPFLQVDAPPAYQAPAQDQTQTGIGSRSVAGQVQPALNSGWSIQRVD